MRNKKDFGQFQPRVLLCSDSFFDDNEDSGSGSSDITNHIIDQVGTLTNTLLLRDANPVNTAILTNTPISTPYVNTGSIGSSMSQGNLLTIGLLVLGAIAVFGVIRAES